MDKVVHFEVPFDDGPRAANFYREAFGWQLNSMPQMQYTMVTTTDTDQQGRPAEAGGINGGMLARQGPITAPVITIGVEDLDDAHRPGGEARRQGGDRPAERRRHGLQRVFPRYRGQPDRALAERLSTPMRVMTWNVFWRFGGDWR